jgi:uncharacterized repeat protein (TIGR03803 family)
LPIATFGGTHGSSATARDDGALKLLYTFTGTPNAGLPYASLIDVRGTLYGTSATGGSGSGYGTVYRITPAGDESVVYGFKHAPDGSSPYGGLLDLDGTLYGTTLTGGADSRCAPNGCGTVFKVTLSGAETVLHSFGDGSDGAIPYGTLIDVNGTLYGTTADGGPLVCSVEGGDGCGTVFKISPSGVESVLYSFKGPPGDAAVPFGRPDGRQRRPLWGNVRRRRE